LGAHKSALAVLKNESSSRAQRVGASFALKRIHAPEVVDSLEKHLNDPSDILFIHAFEILRPSLLQGEDLGREALGRQA
jgi:hypothetical protein